MSWGIIGGEVSRDTIGEELRAAVETYFMQGGWPQSDVLAESKADAFLAAEAAALVVRAASTPSESGGGMVGSEPKVKVTLSGHSNPGHGKRKGWANEFVSIQVIDV